MEKRRCLVIDPMHESLFPMLEETGWEVAYHPKSTREEIKQMLPGFDGLIVRSKTNIDEDLLGDHPTIRFVGRAGAGLDNVDLPYLAARNIAVVHAAEGNRDAVGEYTVGALLALMRNIPRADAQVRNNEWLREVNRGEELMGKTVGIIGYGNMGQAFARKLIGFECKVLAFDKYKSGFSDAYCQEATMDEIFRSADILSLHVPLTAETRRMITPAYISQFAKPLILVNTARGELTSLPALADLLHKRVIRGAVLDVLENEKLDLLTPEQQTAFSFLTRQSNVIFTPHIAGWTFESHIKINVALVQKIKTLSSSLFQ
jgi:D-3-phosphoglycerate dehydrogenase